MKAGTVALLVTFLIALMLGVSIGGGTDTKYKVIHDTDTVTETVEVEVPADPPSECADVVKLAKAYSRAASQFDLTTAGVLDIMSRMRIALAAGDHSTSALLETELRQLNSKTVGAAQVLGENREPFNEAAEACLEGAS